MNVTDYIKTHWDGTVRLNREGDGQRIGLPYEYYVPSIEGMFQEMYYWDTWFTGKGLLLCGREALVKSAVENIFYMIDKFGFMPNGNNVGLFGRSQPPFLSEMVKDLYGVYKDKVWLGTAYSILKKEYTFWKNKRTTPTGLARYGYDMEHGHIQEFADMIRERLAGVDLSGRTDEDLVENFMCDAESGWDFNPRCEYHQVDYNYVDLNSILYGVECNMAYFAEELGNGEEEAWKARAKERRDKINTLLYDGEKYMDYNYKKKTCSPVFSCASFYPLWAKAATEEQAASTVKNLYRIEEAYGVAACEKRPNGVGHQWDYPNGWAPLHYIVIHALDHYGYREDAVRIAEKYVRSIEKIYEETGTLWEKYNVTDGSIKVQDEYKMPEMIGWTAGIYLDLKHYLKEDLL